MIKWYIIKFYFNYNLLLKMWIILGIFLTIKKIWNLINFIVNTKIKYRYTMYNMLKNDGNTKCKFAEDPAYIINFYLFV